VTWQQVASQPSRLPAFCIFLYKVTCTRLCGSNDDESTILIAILDDILEMWQLNLDCHVKPCEANACGGEGVVPARQHQRGNPDLISTFLVCHVILRSAVSSHYVRLYKKMNRR